MLEVRNGYLEGYGKTESGGLLALSTWSGGVRQTQSSTWTLLTDIPPQSLEKGVILVARNRGGSGHSPIASLSSCTPCSTTRTARMIMLSVPNCRSYSLVSI